MITNIIIINSEHLIKLTKWVPTNHYRCFKHQIIKETKVIKSEIKIDCSIFFLLDNARHIHVNVYGISKQPQNIFIDISNLPPLVYRRSRVECANAGANAAGRACLLNRGQWWTTRICVVLSTMTTLSFVDNVNLSICKWPCS